MKVAEKSKNKIGVYVIKNLVNGHRYIGSTARSFEQRYTQHARALKNNKHTSKYLQNAFNKYGASNFEFKIIKICKDANEALSVEQKYIDKNPEYNLSKYAQIPPPVSKATREKIGKAFGIKIDQYDIDGNYLHTFDSFRDAERECGLSLHAIDRYLYKSGNGGGFRWALHGEKPLPAKDTQFKKVDQYTKDGKLIKTWKTIAEASGMLCIEATTISACCLCEENRKTAGGFRWSYHGKPLSDAPLNNCVKAVNQYSLDGTFMATFESVEDAAYKFNVSSTAIIRCCKKGVKHYTTAGYRWSYANEKPKSLPKILDRRRQVEQYDQDGRFINRFDSIVDAYRATGVITSTIKKLANGKKVRKRGNGLNIKWKWKWVK